MGNAQIKLMFPSHEMPFVVPYCSTSELKSKINEIIKDMKKGGILPEGSNRSSLLNGLTLDSPSPDDWVLVDILEAEVIHSTCLAKIRAERTYMVLPMRASVISKESLKEAIKVVDTPKDTVGKPPKYTAT